MKPFPSRSTGPDNGDQPPTPGAEQITLDDQQIAHQKRLREFRLNAVQIPRFRLFGMLALSGLAFAWNCVITGEFNRHNEAAITLVLVAYSLISWLILYRYYSKVQAVNLGFVFLNIDIVFYLLAISQFQGHSLPVAIAAMLSRVADQVGVGFSRAIYFSHAVTIAYAGYLGFSFYFDALAYPPKEAVLGLLTIYVAGLYIASASNAVERLRNRNRKVMQRARELLGQLQQQTLELEEERERAEQASRAKSEFLARMSHEFRTPLNGVLGMIELLETTDLNEKQRRFTATVNRSGHQMLVLVDSVLEFASLESDNVALEISEKDLATLIDEVLDTHRREAEDKEIKLTAAISDSLQGRIETDCQRLQQILSILITNAIKFSESGTIIVHVSPAVPADSHRSASIELVFAVSDQGIGIAPEHHEQVFERFFQIDGADNRTYGGTGIGLAICKHLVELLGGSIGLDSEPGAGSRFWVQIPVQFRHTPLEPHTNDSTIRLLVADDNAINCELTVAMLKNLGWDAESVNSGAAVLAKLDQDPTQYALILLDCYMPGLDGITTAAEIRSRELASGQTPLPIVALTADSQENIREKCLLAGMNDVITKPFTKESLGQPIENLLKRMLTADRD